MMRWWQLLRAEDILVPARHPRPELSLDDDARALLGVGALNWAHALAEDLTREYVEVSIPELARSADFTQGLQISAEANILGILLDLSSDDSVPQPPREALEFADEAVVRQVPLAAILRGYRLGVEHWLRWCAPAIERHSGLLDQAEELQFSVRTAVRYIDRLSEIMIVEYERELHGRATSGAARRAALVSAVLSGDATDLDETSRQLHYPLRGRHMALSLHASGGNSKQVDILEAEVRSFAAAVGATGVLTFATGLATMDAWVTVPAHFERPENPAHENVMMGVGSSFAGLPGFIQSHREAQEALQLLQMAAPGRLDGITYYDQVRLLSLLVKDIPAAREFVASTLGKLAGADERSHELRGTLLAFFQENKSHTAVAQSTHLHKNTVIQRVSKANEQVGRDLTKDVDVHVALMLVDILESRVLGSD
ncbi:PucR family transcriptional regulator [Paenarthrobacter aromaticivorans]|uniref:PucR family transcriptional regulator n=1 Tax=Paenarthrobacter aromaticivorans TaxID=2849150 RepID=UPI003A810C64